MRAQSVVTVLFIALTCGALAFLSCGRRALDAAGALDDPDAPNDDGGSPEPGVP